MADLKSALNNVNSKDYKINTSNSSTQLSGKTNNYNNDDYEEIDYSNPTESPQTNNTDVSQMPDYSQNDIVKTVDKEIENLEKQIKDLEKQIKDKEENMSNVFEKVWRAVFFQDDSEQDKNLSKEIDKLEKQKSELENQISELKTLKTNYVNTLKEDFYLSIPNNSDFKDYSQTNITEEEVEELLKALALLTDAAYSPFVKEEMLTDYEALEKFLKENGYVLSNSVSATELSMDLELLKSAYEKGYNLFDVVSVAKEDSLSIMIDIGLLGEEYEWIIDANYLINYMTEEEVALIKYFYNTQGIEAAKKYFRFKEDELNNRKGLDKALKFIETIDANDPDVGDYVNTHFKGLGDGIDNFWEGINNALGGMDGKVSAEQYEAMYIMYYLQDNKGLTIDYELSSAIGNMLPSMAASAIVSLAATPAAGTLVGSALMGLSAGGNAAEMAYQEGNGYWESVFYGTLSGASESVLSYFLGGIPFLSKIDDIPGVKGYLLNVLKEGGEESIQSILDPYLKNVALGTKETVDWEEVAKSGVYGMIIAGYLNGGQLTVEGTNVAVQKLEEAVMIAEELGIDPNKYKNPLALLNDPDIKNYKKMASKLKNIDYKKEKLKSYNLNSSNNLETLKDVNQDFKGKDFLGGDQGSFYNAYTKKFKNQILKQEIIELENIIKKHKPEYTNQEILELATKVKETGCSLVDVANNIFEQLNYDSEKFSSLFGFSMFKSNGSLNHNALILDIVSFFEDKVEVKVKGTYKTNTYDSNITAANQILGTNFSDNTEAFIALTNNNVRIDGNTYTYFEKNPSNYIGDYKDISKQFGLDVDSLEDFQTQLKQKNIVASVESADIPSKLTTLNIKNHDKWMNLYFNYKNIDLAFTTDELHFKDYDSLVTEIESNIKNGNSISVGVRPSSEVSMTDGSKFGWFNFGNFNNAGHVMSFRGINDNGDIVVSSWGKYYTIPKEYVSDLEFKSRKLESVLDYSSTENIDIFEIDEQLLESPNLFSKKYKFKMDLKSVPKDYRKGYKDFFLNISSTINMNKEIGENLEKIFDTENYVIGIHKSGMANPNSILENGLFLTGHSSSGIGSFDGLLDLNIVFEQQSGFRDADFLRFCNNIKGSAGYKTTTGNGNAIIVKIPKSDFNDINKLTYFDGQYNLKPEYIMGYVKTVSNSSGNVTFEDIIYNSKYIDSNYKILTDFKSVFNDGNSDTKLINLISEQFENSIKSGNKDAAITLKKLVELKMVDPTLKLKMALPSKKHAVSYYQHSTKSINIMPDSLKKESLTCYHELFHMLDYAYSYKQGIYKAPNDYELIFDKARDHLLKNGNKLLNEFVYKYQNIWKYQRNEANKLFSKKIEQLGFENFDSYRNNLIFQYNDMLNSMDDDRIIKYIESLEIGRYIQSGKVDGAILADAEIAATFNSLKKEALSNLKNTLSYISDIADALLKGNVYNDLKMSGHGKKYYARQYSDFKEIIAQFGTLKIGAPERLEDIKYFFGEDFYNYMEEAYKLRVREKENIWK